MEEFKTHLTSKWVLEKDKDDDDDENVLEVLY